MALSYPNAISFSYQHAWILFTLALTWLGASRYLLLRELARVVVVVVSTRGVMVLIYSGGIGDALDRPGFLDRIEQEKS